jgi:hypothetical protein
MSTLQSGVGPCPALQIDEGVLPSLTLALNQSANETRLEVEQGMYKILHKTSRITGR